MYVLTFENILYIDVKQSFNISFSCISILQLPRLIKISSETNMNGWERQTTHCVDFLGDRESAELQVEF